MCKGKFLYFRLIAARGGNILIESCRFPRGIVIDRGGGGKIEEVLIVGGQ